MKQIIPAILVLAVVLAFGTTSGIMIASLSNKIVSDLENAREEIKGGNWGNAEEGIQKALKRWESSRHALGLIAGDSDLSATDAALSSVESSLCYRRAEELDMHIRLAVLLVKGISQREALHWHNVG